jgi:hypothetical protein
MRSPGVAADRGVERGELPRGVDASLIGSTVAGAVLQRVVVERQAPTDGYLAALIDLVLTGVRPVADAGSAARAPRIAQGKARQG